MVACPAPSPTGGTAGASVACFDRRSAFRFSAAPARCRQQGFLLVEALVAVAVLAIGLGALIRATNASLGTLTETRMRVLAHELALERLTSFQLGLLPSRTLPLRGDASLAGQDVQWVIEASGGLLTIRVRLGDDRAALASMSLPLP